MTEETVNEMTATELTATELSVSIGTRRILDRISFAGCRGEMIGVIGPNGAGKSTLLRALLGLVPVDGGLDLDGRNAWRLHRRARARLMSYLPQDVDTGWPITAREVVALGREPHIGAFGRFGAEDRRTVERAMAACDVTDLADREATSLSAGERARVLMARALAVNAPLLLVDEPTAALDPFHQLSVMEVLRAYADDGRLVLAALHDLSLAARFCDRLLLIDQGRLIANGGVDEVLSESNLRDVYRIEARRGSDGDIAFILPWRRFEREEKNERRTSEP